MARAITVLSDFGTVDGYVASMQGVIATACPDVITHHATHDIPAGDVEAGAFALGRYWALFPKGTVHLCVVDPGVGGDRLPIVVEADGRMGVGPDNGVLEPMLARADAVYAIANTALMRPMVSATFHGRDIFAPVAAWLACGGISAFVGPRVDRPVRLVRPALFDDGHVVTGVIVSIDRFGNLVTNIPAADAAGTVVIGDARIGPVRSTYASVAAGELLALIGSTGFLEVSVRNGSAADRLEARRGDVVRLFPGA